MEKENSLCNNPSHSQENQEFSFDLSQLGIFTNSKEKSDAESSGSRKKDDFAPEKFDEKNPEKMQNYEYLDVGKGTGFASQWKVDSKLKNKGFRLRRQDDKRTTSFIHYSPATFNGSNESFLSNEYNRHKRNMFSASFSGNPNTYGEKNIFASTTSLPFKTFKTLQSSGSLRKRSQTNRTLTTMTPENSQIYKSGDLTKSRFSGSILNSQNKYLFGTGDTGNSSDQSQPFYIEENTNSFISKNSQEMLFYNYFNPIYEDVDESRLISEENYEDSGDREAIAAKKSPETGQESTMLFQNHMLQKLNSEHQRKPVGFNLSQKQKYLGKQDSFANAQLSSNRVSSSSNQKMNGLNGFNHQNSYRANSKLQKSSTTYIPNSAEAKFLSGNGNRLGLAGAGLGQYRQKNLLGTNQFAPKAPPNQFIKNHKLKKKRSVFGKQPGFNLSDVHITQGKKGKKLLRGAKNSDKKDKKTRRNYMRISNSQAYDIKLGDKRNTDTTLMIANIPNKYTQELLLQDINQKFQDAWDFFYLPMDFDNKCNRGFAFLNLIDYKQVKEFFKEYHNKKWKKFNSAKICEIRYARIQGKKANMKQFQGTCVMKQNDRSYKPLLIDMENIKGIVQKQKEGNNGGNLKKKQSPG